MPNVGASVNYDSTNHNRFSLKVLLLVVTLAASIFGNIVSTLRLRNVTAQRDQLRREVGFLEPSGPTEIAAVRVPFDQPLAWKFLARVPGNTKYRLAYSTFWPAETAQPQWIGAQALPPGEYTVLARVLSDPRDDRWKMTVVVRNDSATLRGSFVLDERQTQLFRSSNDTLQLGIGRETQAVAQGQRLRILDQRWIGGEGGLLLYGSRPPEDPIDGVFLELQPDSGALN